MTRHSSNIDRPCTQHSNASNTYTDQYNRLTARWSGTTRVGQYQKKHSPTHTHPDHQTSSVNFLHLLQSIASSLFNLRAWQSFSTTSLQVLLVWDPQLHTPCISSPSHHLLYAAHAHINAACHPFLISLSAPYLEICLLA